MLKVLYWFFSITAFGLLGGCAGTYKPPVGVDTIELRVEADAQKGIPGLSYTDVTLWADQISDKLLYGTRHQRIPLWWQKVDLDKPDANVFILPADKPLDVSLSYSSGQLFGGTLSGSGSYLFVPEANKSYVMRFWTDRQKFSVKLFEMGADGELKPAKALRDDGTY